MKKFFAVCLAAAMMLALGTAALAASGEGWGEYSMVNDGYGYLTANFPAVYPADEVVGEGTQVVSDKTDAILLTMTEGEMAEMLRAFSRPVVIWDGCARMGIPAVREGAAIDAAAIFTSFDALSLAEELTPLALKARAEGCNALRLVGLDAFPAALAEAAGELFAQVMNENGVIALVEEAAASGEPSVEPSGEPSGEPFVDVSGEARECLAAMGAAGYLQYMQISRDGTAALDTMPPPVIEPEALDYSAPIEAGDTAIVLPENAAAGERFEIVAYAPAEAMSAMLRDEAGENLPIADMLKENLGDGVRFTFTLAFDAPVTMPVYLYTMTTAGWSSEAIANAILEVK